MAPRVEEGHSAEALHAPIGDILGRVAHELRHLSERLDRVEALVGPLIQDAAPRDGALVRGIQDLDHVRQKAGALADFLGALARMAPDAWRVDAGAAASFVTLADLAARLTLAEAGAGPAGAQGECELL